MAKLVNLMWQENTPTHENMNIISERITRTTAFCLEWKGISMLSINPLALFQKATLIPGSLTVGKYMLI